MGFFSKIYGWFGDNALADKKGEQETTPSTNPHPDSSIIGVDSALQVSTVWACVSLLVENIASLPVEVFKAAKEGREKDSSSRLYQIFHFSPNRRQTSFEFWEQMLLNFVLRGNAYARVDRDNNGEVIALWPLSSDQMEVFVLDNGSLSYFYHVDQKTLVFLEVDMMHIRGMGNGVVGLSPLDHMKSSVSLAINAQNHTVKTYKKNARRPGVLLTNGVLDPVQRKQVKEVLGGLVNGNDEELHVLEAEFKFEPLGMTPADIQLLESRKFSVQDLARWFGVPSVLVNDTGESTSLGSSVQQIMDGFYKLKLRPMIERFEQVINARVLTSTQRSQGIVVEFNFNALLRASLKDRMEIYAKGVQNGVYTRNECRGKENLKRIDGADALTAQSNLMPLDKLGQQTMSGGSVPPETVEQ